MSIARNDMTTAQAQFETWLSASPVLQTVQAALAELTQRIGNIEQRLDRTERRGEIAIERIAALTGLVNGLDPRLVRVEERGVRLEEQLKAHTGQTQQNFDNFMGRYDDRFEQVDKRFEQVDQRFEQVDKRLEQIDQRIIGIESKLDRFHWSVLAGLGVIVMQSLVMNFL
jgi:chromosome segregation ATPase